MAKKDTKAKKEKEYTQYSLRVKVNSPERQWLDAQDSASATLLRIIRFLIKKTGTVDYLDFASDLALSQLYFGGNVPKLDTKRPVEEVPENFTKNIKNDVEKVAEPEKEIPKAVQEPEQNPQPQEKQAAAPSKKKNQSDTGNIFDDPALS